MTDYEEINTAGWKLDNSYAGLPDDFYQKLEPQPVDNPEMVIFNSSLASELGLDAEEMEKDAGVNVLAGNKMPADSVPIAQAYAGHQFGTYNMLGDGRGLLIGEQKTPSGMKVDLQLKGSGSTNYSRGMDGRAALGPMLREYIISEAMYGLGVPTSRSLAVLKTGETITREENLTGAIMTRAASSHIGVGTFQFAAGLKDNGKLKALADYAIERHYPEIADEPDRYLQFFKAVGRRQAELIAQWQLLGFIHGVMNTDNMAISGETIDYGPCAFLDRYYPQEVFSSIDEHGRYAYNKQPSIARWNLEKLGGALAPLLHDDPEQTKELIHETLSQFTAQYQQNWLTGMRRKLGIFNDEEQDEILIEELLNMMQQNEADYTNTFRSFSMNQPADTVLSGKEVFNEWYEKWQARLDRQQESMEESQDLMKKNNPAIIPRNHTVEAVLEAAVEHDDYSGIEKLVEALNNPFAYLPEQDEYANPPEDSNKPHVTYCGT